MIEFQPDPGPRCPDCVRVIVEIPKGSTNRYEYDEKLGLFRMTSALYSPLHYPGDYGFIPGTLAEDGYPLDVLVMTTEPSFPGCMLESRPIGLLELEDGSVQDSKVLAVPDRNPRYDTTRSIQDVYVHFLTEIQHFFQIYKELEGPRLQMRGWQGPGAARDAIQKSREQYLQHTTVS